MTESNNNFVIFTLDNQKFAIPLVKVGSIARTVQITPLPNAPDVIQGVINVHGRIIPVVNIRKRFRFAEKELDLDDHLIIARNSSQPIAIMVDTVEDIIEISNEKIVKQQDILPGLDYVEGAVKIEGDVIIIHNIEKCLSVQEEHLLTEVMMEKGKQKQKIGQREETVRR